MQLDRADKKFIKGILLVERFQTVLLKKLDFYVLILTNTLNINIEKSN